MGRLKNKVAIITGGASGMGFAAVELFEKEGAKVVALDINETNLEKVKALGLENILALKLDITDANGWEEVVKTTVEKFGKIDILVNNAGLQLGAQGIFDTTEEAWDLIMNVNLKSVWLSTKAVIPVMQQNGGGSIINTSSIGGLVGGLADGGSAAYSAAKGGVRSFTKHLANAFGQDNIRVNSVHPGTTATGGSGGKWDAEAAAAYMKLLDDATPLARKVADPIDIAYMYLYLASDESKFATGAEFVVDGGLISH